MAIAAATSLFPVRSRRYQEKTDRSEGTAACGYSPLWVPIEDRAGYARVPEARAVFREKGGGHLFVEPIRAVRAVNGGLQRALLETYRLDMRPLDLTRVMNLLLQGNRSLADSWMAGQQPFEAAVLDGQS